MAIESAEDVAEIIKNDFTNPIFPDISIYDTEDILNVFGTDDFPDDHIPDDWNEDELPDLTSFEHFLRKIELEKWESTIDVLERLYIYIDPEDEQDILGLSDEEVEAMQETDIVSHVFDFFEQIGIEHDGELPELDEELNWEEELSSIGAIELKEFTDPASLRERDAYIFTDDVIHQARELIDEDYERHTIPDLTMENADAINQVMRHETIRQEIEDEDGGEDEEEDVGDGEEEVEGGEDNYQIIRTYPNENILYDYFEDRGEALIEYDNFLETDNQMIEIKLTGPDGETIFEDTNEIDIYAVITYGDDGHKLIFATMDPEAEMPVWWEDIIEEREDIDEDGDWYVEIFRDIPADVAHNLVKQGTDEQVYSDDYAAYTEAVNQLEGEGAEEDEEYTIIRYYDNEDEEQTTFPSAPLATEAYRDYLEDISEERDDFIGIELIGIDGSTLMEMTAETYNETSFKIVAVKHDGSEEITRRDTREEAEDLFDDTVSEMIEIDSNIESVKLLGTDDEELSAVTLNPDRQPVEKIPTKESKKKMPSHPELLLTEKQLDAYARFYSLTKRMDRSIYECNAPCLGLLELDDSADILKCTRCGKIYDEDETASRIYGQEPYRIDKDDIEEVTVNFIKINTGGNKIAPEKIDIDDIDIEMEAYDENDPEDNEDAFITEELVNIPSRIWSSSPSMQTVLSSIPSRDDRVTLIDSVYFKNDYKNKHIYFTSDRTIPYESIIDTLFINSDATDIEESLRAIDYVHLFFEYCALFDAGYVESDVDPFGFLKAMYTQTVNEFEVYMKEHNIDFPLMRADILSQIIDKDDKFDMAGHANMIPATSVLEFNASLPFLKRYYNYLISKLEGKKYNDKKDWTNELIPKSNIKLCDELNPVSTTRLFEKGPPIITIVEPPETHGTNGRIEGYKDGMIYAKINRTPVAATPGRKYDIVSIPREYITDINPPHSINIGHNMIDIFMYRLVQKHTYHAEESDEYSDEKTFNLYLYTHYNNARRVISVTNFKSEEDREKFIDAIPDYIPDFYTEKIIIRKMDDFDIGGLAKFELKNGKWAKEEESENYDDIMADLKEEYDVDSISEYIKSVIDEWGEENNIDIKYNDITDIGDAWFMGIRTKQGKTESVNTFLTLPHIIDAYFDIIDTPDSPMMMKISSISEIYICPIAMAYEFDIDNQFRVMQETIYGESELMVGDKIYIDYGIDDIKTFSENINISEFKSSLDQLLYKMADDEDEDFMPTNIYIHYDDSIFPIKFTIMKEQIQDLEFRRNADIEFDHRILHYLDKPLDIQKIDIYIAASKQVNDNAQELVEYIKFSNSNSRLLIIHILPAYSSIITPNKMEFVNVIQTRHEFANEISRNETVVNIRYEEQLSNLEDGEYNILAMYNNEGEE